MIEASAPARIDLAGGTLDLWPLHVLHPGSVTVNLAIGLRASCRVREGSERFRVRSSSPRLEKTADSAREFLADPSTALVGSILEALAVARPVEIELASEVPFGSGLGGSSALTVALSAALEPFGGRVVEEGERVDFLRDVETRVLGKPAGVQDYYPPLGGGLHRLFFEPGRTRVDRRAADPVAWDRHLTLFDTGVGPLLRDEQLGDFPPSAGGGSGGRGESRSGPARGRAHVRRGREASVRGDGLGPAPGVGGSQKARSGGFFPGNRALDRGGPDRRCLGRQGVRRGRGRLRRDSLAGGTDPFGARGPFPVDRRESPRGPGRDRRGCASIVGR